VVDALGNPLHVVLSAGQLHDVTFAEAALSAVPVEGSIILADKGYDSAKLVSYIETRNGTANIPSRSTNSDQRSCDWWLYKERHLVECFFQKLKNFRRIATRYDKRDDSFLALFI
jgi:transposase